MAAGTAIARRRISRLGHLLRTGQLVVQVCCGLLWSQFLAVAIRCQLNSHYQEATLTAAGSKRCSMRFAVQGLSM